MLVVISHFISCEDIKVPHYLCHEQPDLLEFDTSVIASRPGAVVLGRSALHPGGGGVFVFEPGHPFLHHVQFENVFAPGEGRGYRDGHLD